MTRLKLRLTTKMLLLAGATIFAGVQSLTLQRPLYAKNSSKDFHGGHALSFQQEKALFSVCNASFSSLQTVCTSTLQGTSLNLTTPGVGREPTFDCSPHVHGKKVNFLAAADGPHIDFLILYATFALRSNADSFVEIVVRDREKFILDKAEALSSILQAFGKETVCVRNF